MISAGFIGYKNHAGRIRRIVEDLGLAKTQYIYHPSKDLGLENQTNNLNDLLGCDAVFVLSPNHSHFNYLKYFSERFSGYIYCEKPPVATEEEFQQLISLDLNPGRVFFNFHLRCSRLREMLESSIEEGSLGQLLNCHISITQGLAYKEGYEDSWRADASSHKHGVAETKAIHYLDLLSLLFGEPTEVNYRPSNRSGKGTAFDTCHFHLVYANGLVANLMMSYAAPLTFELSFLGSNGVLEYKNKKLNLYSPRNSFDERGYFVHPPLESEYHYGEGLDMTQESHERSVAFFLNHCQNKSSIPKKLFEQSLKTNQFILNLDA